MYLKNSAYFLNSPRIYIYRASVTQLLVRAIAVREVPGSSHGRCRHKNLCRRREPSDSVSFRRAVKRRRFHTLNTHDTKPKQHNNTPYKRLHVGTGPRSVPTRCRLVISSRMTNRAICCVPERRFPPTIYT